MSSYDPSRHQIPAMRPAGDASAHRSATPIYDELYAEWRRSFRALPGDRVGEEELNFTGFDSHPQPYGQHRPMAGHHPGQHPHQHQHPGQPMSWYGAPQQTPRLPAALPPAPRREHH